MADTIRFPGTGVRRAAALARLGAVLGLLGAKYVLVGSGWNLLPWGLVALLVGFTAGSRRRAAVDAGIYGFALSFVFMIAGYSARAPLAGRLWFFVQLGLFGAACAALIAVVGRQPYSWLTAASSAIRQHRRGRLLDPDGVPSRSYPLREQATTRCRPR